MHTHNAAYQMLSHQGRGGGRVCSSGIALLRSQEASRAGAAGRPLATWVLVVGQNVIPVLLGMGIRLC